MPSIIGHTARIDPKDFYFDNSRLDCWSEEWIEAFSIVSERMQQLGYVDVIGDLWMYEYSLVSGLPERPEVCHFTLNDPDGAAPFTRIIYQIKWEEYKTNCWRPTRYYTWWQLGADGVPKFLAAPVINYDTSGGVSSMSPGVP